MTSDIANFGHCIVTGFAQLNNFIIRPNMFCCYQNR